MSSYLAPRHLRVTASVESGCLDYDHTDHGEKEGCSCSMHKSMRSRNLHFYESLYGPYRVQKMRVVHVTELVVSMVYPWAC